MNFGKRATNRKRNALSSHSTMIGKKANVSVYMGSVFGEAGRGYIRLNLASPRQMLDEAYHRMLKVWKDW